MSLQKAFLKLPLRAEKEDESLLVETFVDAGMLFTLLSSVDHQILYGRRGTGKTHALKYVAEDIRRNRGEVSLYIDVRTIGSSGGVYNDADQSLAERATRLLIDLLGEMNNQLSELALGETELQKQCAPELMARLNAFVDEAARVHVVGTVEREIKVTEKDTQKAGMRAGAEYPLKVTGEMSSEASHSSGVEARRVEKGEEKHRVHFGGVSTRLRDVVGALPKKRLWLFIDEWSVIPRDLQPYLGDFLRHCVLPVPGVTLKIGAIEQRSRMRVVTEAPDYIGMEVGADVSANLDLDDFMVFNNDAERAKTFMRDLLFRHVRAVFEAEGYLNPPANADEMLAAAFTQSNAFAEFVRAAEGVPRDAFNILGLAVQKAGADKLSVQHIRTAARSWYQRDKFSSVSASQNAGNLLKWIVSEVIGNRNARAFLLEQGKDHSLIGILYDARVLHVLKRGVHGGDVAGVRFNAYALDYGCYVDLITTSKAPRGLFVVEDEDGQEQWVEVPQDDYRSIRRAILDLDVFDRSQRFG
jgi:hypothetical protein